MSSNPPKRQKITDPIDSISSSIQTLSAQLLLADSAVRRLKDEHNREISNANRQFSALLRGSSTSNEHSKEHHHQLELQCIRLEGENAALKSAREKDSIRLKELESAETIRQRAWAGLDASEIRLILQYERQAFETAPESCVQRRVELRYNQETVEQTRKACAEQIRQADEQLRGAAQAEERAATAETKATHLEQKWTLLRGRMHECEAEAARVRKEMATITRELLNVAEESRSAQSRLAAALAQNAVLAAEVESKRSEIKSLRTEGVEAVVRKEYAERMARMEAEHKAELDSLKSTMLAKINELKRRGGKKGE
jgi:hypothetical protein